MRHLLIIIIFFYATSLFANGLKCIDKQAAIQTIKTELIDAMDINDGYDLYIYEQLTSPENISFIANTYYSSFEDIESWIRVDIEVDCNGGLTYTSGSYNGD